MANPFVHIELNTSDVAKSKEFYGSLFDWQMEDLEMAEGPYTMINVGDDGTGGGMMTQPMPNTPSAWLPYVEVENIEEMTDKASSLGAKVIMEVTEIPEMGWLSIFVDPTGAMLGLWEAMSDEDEEELDEEEEDED